MAATSVEILHKPRCSKSRATLALLRERGVDPTVTEYLKTAPDAATLCKVRDLLGLEPRELMRRKEQAYSALGLDREDLSRNDLIAAMVDNPILIERPIVLASGKAALGRPPESVLAIL